MRLAMLIKELGLSHLHACHLWQLVCSLELGSCWRRKALFVCLCNPPAQKYSWLPRMAGMQIINGSLYSSATCLRWRIPGKRFQSAGIAESFVGADTEGLALVGGQGGVHGQTYCRLLIDALHEDLSICALESCLNLWTLGHVVLVPQHGAFRFAIALTQRV